MADGKLSRSLQETILTALCFSDKHGALIAGIVTADIFEPPYSDIAERALAYRAKYHHAPGTAHIDDLFDHVLEDPKNDKAPSYRRILTSMVELATNGFKPAYAADRAASFVRKQTIKGAVLKASERLMRPGHEDTMADDLEAVLWAALRKNIQSFDPGLRLTDDVAFDYLERQVRAESWPLGIPEFDHRGLGPTRGEMLLFMAPKKFGKSWFAIHAAKMALLLRAKVLHISLEMRMEQIVPRYFQTFFSVAKRPDEYQSTLFEFDRLQKLSGLATETVKPAQFFSNPEARKWLEARVDAHGAKIGNLIIKCFPSGSLSMMQLIAFLDRLSAVDGFDPDILIVDMPILMKWDMRHERRIALGQIGVDLRGLAGERHMALVAPHHVNRLGGRAKQITEEHIAEDASLVGTADIVMSGTRTKAERRLNLARLYVSHARNDEDEISVLITQSYRTGQFVIDSVRMDEDVEEVMAEALNEHRGEDE